MTTIESALWSMDPEVGRMYSFCLASQAQPHQFPCDEHWRSPLHYAITFQALDVLEQYLSQRIYDVNAPDLLGDTPLIHAIKLYTPEAADITRSIVYLLFKYGADANVGMPGSTTTPTPLMLAVLKEDVPLVQSLLLMGADPNTRINDEGLFFKPNDTALSIAVRLNTICGTNKLYTKGQLDCIQTIMQQSQISISSNVLFHALQQTKHKELKDYVLACSRNLKI